MSRILVSGASGFIGRALSVFLASEGHQVIALTRKKQRGSIFWDPETNKADLNDFEGFDALIHLAGEPLSLRRWSKRKKRKILQSRVLGTLFLSDLLSHLIRPPEVFISASAVGYYGERGDEELFEESRVGSGFLAHVCSEWEKASDSLKRLKIRTVHARFGMVLAKEGGFLKKITSIYKLGFGAKLGSGKQWISWIAKEDLIRGMNFILKDPSIEGPVNLVSPNPIRQIELSKTLAKILHRPHFLFIPKWVLKIFFGSVADELILASEKVRPSKLLASNFIFHYADLQCALTKALFEK